ncbi:ATPase, partial [Bacteroides caecigallinarum]|nr:ATPase [Bacteroides caecigallinarum]
IKHEAQVKNFLCECFTDFFERNVMKYDTSLEISFTGSVSWYFQEEIKETAKRLNLKTGKFIKEPIWGLKEFHNNQ